MTEQTRPSTGGGVTDHGALTGLADDDHTQYHNDTRGDARYAPLAKGVTNGDSHDHSGGDGAQIAYSALSGLPTLGTAAAQNVGAFEAAGAVATHEADTTSIHGIADTSALLDTADIGVSVAAQSHNHAASAITSGTIDTARLGSGTANSGSYLRGDQTWATIAGGGDVTGPASSVDSEIALFSSTTGKVIKRASTTGLLKATSGVLSAATAGTDYQRPLVLVATLASDQATGANTTPVTLTGLSFSYEANAVYRIWAMGQVSPAAATTGCGFQFDTSTTFTELSVQFFHQLASTGTLSGGHSIADDASVGVSSGLPGTSTYPATVFGLLRTNANAGTAQMRFRSETTAVITCKAGFTLVVERVA